MFKQPAKKCRENKTEIKNRDKKQKAKQQKKRG